MRELQERLGKKSEEDRENTHAEDRIEESERSTREGNIAKKVKKKNKIKIKERLCSLFYATF